MKKIIFSICILCTFLLVGLFSLTLNSNRVSRPKVNPTSPISPTPTLVQSTEEIINKSNITNGTRQFVSDKYKLSFSYPYDWQILDEPNVNGIEIQKINNQGAGFSISLRINENPQNLSIEDYTKNQAFNLPNGVKDIPQKITIGNIQGYKLQYLPQGLLTTIYLPYKNGKILYIFAGGEFDKSSQTLDFYNHVVNNFLTTLRVE